MVEKEACPLNLAPTTSIIAALGVADALAVGLMVSSDYKAEEFAVNHPAGTSPMDFVSLHPKHRVLPCQQKNIFAGYGGYHHP